MKYVILSSKSGVESQTPLPLESDGTQYHGNGQWIYFVHQWWDHPVCHRLRPVINPGFTFPRLIDKVQIIHFRIIKGADRIPIVLFYGEPWSDNQGIGQFKRSAEINSLKLSGVGLKETVYRNIICFTITNDIGNLLLGFSLGSILDHPQRPLETKRRYDEIVIWIDFVEKRECQPVAFLYISHFRPGKCNILTWIQHVVSLLSTTGDNHYDNT